MKTIEVETKRKVISIEAEEIEKLERWFRNEYIERKATIDRYTFLNLPKVETRMELEIEAYQKEQRLRELKGYPKLPDIKIGTLI